MSDLVWILLPFCAFGVGFLLGAAWAYEVGYEDGIENV